MSITFRTNRLPVHNLSTSERPVVGSDAEPTVLVAHLSNQSHADAFLRFRYVHHDNGHSFPDRLHRVWLGRSQVRGAGTGGVSPIGQECPSASIGWYPIWAVALRHLPKEVIVRARHDFAWPKLLTADGRGIAFGGDYSPDQWPEEIWDDDIRLMGQADVNTVALAIFS